MSAAAKRGRRVPDRLRFVTYTTRYADCFWLTVDGLEKTYERAEVEAARRGPELRLSTRNVTRPHRAASRFDRDRAQSTVKRSRPPPLQPRQRSSSGARRVNGVWLTTSLRCADPASSSARVYRAPSTTPSPTLSWRCAPAARHGTAPWPTPRGGDSLNCIATSPNGSAAIRPPPPTTGSTTPKSPRPTSSCSATRSPTACSAASSASFPCAGLARRSRSAAAASTPRVTWLR